MLRDIGGDGVGGGSRWRVPKHQDVETIRNYEAILLFQLWIAFFWYPEFVLLTRMFGEQTAAKQQMGRKLCLTLGVKTDGLLPAKRVGNV